MRRRFGLVFNSRAGTLRPLMLERVLTALRARGADVRTIDTTSASDASRRVRDAALAGGLDAIIAAGGDGTIRAVAAGLAGLDTPLGIIPLGTGNVMKYEIGLGGRASEIAATLLDGQAVPVQGGFVNGEPFFLMAGAGFDGRIVAGLGHATKKAIGRAAYCMPVLRALAAGADRFAVEADGDRYAASWVIVTNAAHYGGSFWLTRETQMGAGKLIAIIVTGGTRRALLRAGLALPLGRLGDPERHPAGVVVRPVSRLLIGGAAVHLEVDGDDAGFTPAEIVAGGPHVRFIVPPAYAAALTKRHANHLSSHL